MHAIFNIGIGGNEGTDEHVKSLILASRRARVMAWLCKFDEFAVEFRNDMAEPTLVVEVPNIKTNEKEIVGLCFDIEQDCIACKFWSSWRPGVMHPRLIGPHPHAWEPFDEDKFANPSWRFR